MGDYDRKVLWLVLNRMFLIAAVVVLVTAALRVFFGHIFRKTEEDTERILKAEMYVYTCIYMIIATLPINGFIPGRHAFFWNESVDLLFRPADLFLESVRGLPLYGVVWIDSRLLDYFMLLFSIFVLAMQWLIPMRYGPA